MLLFFEKKSNQIKTKNISSERVEVQRAETNDTLKHPRMHIYVILPWLLPFILSSTRFFPCVLFLPAMPDRT